MKATRIGWVGKNRKLEISRHNKGHRFEFDHIYIEPIVYGSRGTRVDWEDNDWPPVKVCVAVFDPAKYELVEKEGKG
jgi:hypothetical protein